ncbi:hypothetical protein MMC17_003793 [Xylographa soralifera]|nr:hypothetical protein [Xylographa soralifera]
MRRVVKSVGAGIGLATEAYAARKSSSASHTAEGQQNTVAGGSSAIKHGRHEEELPRAEDDEADWDLDDAVAEQEGAEADEKETGKSTMSVDHLAQIFIRQHPPPAELGSYELPCPVILPQRRPRDKSRGFVRAYAPVLSDCGIDEVTFMQFLEAFHQASKASPVFTVINVAANVVGNVPSVAAIVTSIAVQVVFGVAKEMHSRTRSNSFLDQLNEKFFQPRGLYCIIMTYKPDSTSSHETVDISETIQSKIDPSGSSWHEKMNKIKASSGKTYGELEMPLAAPLIYPSLDAAADATSNEKQKQNALKKSQKFVADYYDRRAQATYAGENMESSLSVPQTTEFASRYSDPNHAANNGSLISLITGGNINPQPRQDDRRNRLSDRREKRGGPSSMVMPSGTSKGGKKERPIRRLLKKDVLYLIIVNMPTEEELNTAKRMIAEKARPARNQ